MCPSPDTPIPLKVRFRILSWVILGLNTFADLLRGARLIPDYWVVQRAEELASKASKITSGSLPVRALLIEEEHCRLEYAKNNIQLRHLLASQKQYRLAHLDVLTQLRKACPDRLVLRDILKDVYEYDYQREDLES